MKVWISCDMEGVAGIVDWDQCRPGGDSYALGCALLLDEVNSAIAGAVDGGATGVVVNDSHSRMANLDPRLLVGGAQYLSGRHKPRYMMEGLDETVDAVFFVGYHGSISGEPSTLSHTYNPEVISRATLNGVEVGESGINALVVEHLGVPIVLVTGDAVTHRQTAPFAPDAVSVTTKTSITRFSAQSLHPSRSCELIRDGAAVALGVAAAGARLPGLPRPSTLELELQTGDMAEVATWAKGVERSGERSVTIAGDDLLRVYDAFVAVTYLTRQAGGR